MIFEGTWRLWALGFGCAIFVCICLAIFECSLVVSSSRPLQGYDGDTASLFRHIYLLPAARDL